MCCCCCCSGQVFALIKYLKGHLKSLGFLFGSVFQQRFSGSWGLSDNFWRLSIGYWWLNYGSIMSSVTKSPKELTLWGQLKMLNEVEIVEKRSKNLLEEPAERLPRGLSGQLPDPSQ